MKTSQQLMRKQSKQFGTPFQLACKRLIDITVSSAALLMLSPVLLATAVCIMADDGRPVIFKQKRSGRNDTVFHIYKFRSMANRQIVNTATNGTDHSETPSESGVSMDPHAWKNGVPDDFVFKSSANPNITKLGRFIRKYSLDELPQFLNVLKGDMSLIGPRPEILEITRYYNAQQRQRLAVKPGISGLAQANGRSMNHGEKIRHDLDYVHNFSLRLDIKIIFKTINNVLRARDAI